MKIHEVVFMAACIFVILMVTSVWAYAIAKPDEPERCSNAVVVLNEFDHEPVACMPGASLNIVETTDGPVAVCTCPDAP